MTRSGEKREYLKQETMGHFMEEIGQKRVVLPQAQMWFWAAECGKGGGVHNPVCTNAGVRLCVLSVFRLAPVVRGEVGV